MSEESSSTRERLIESARNLFMKQGYASTGVAQILREAGANSGSLYHYFPTKEDLLLAVLEWYIENLWNAVLNPVWQRVSDPIERTFGVLDGYRQMLHFTECGMGCPIGNLALEVSDTLPAARDLIARNFTNWRDALRFSLEDARDRFPEDVDFNQLATFVLTTMEGGVMLSRAYRSVEPFDAAVTQLRDYFDRLLADGTNWSEPPATSTAKAKPAPRAPRAATRPRRTH